MQVRRQCQWIHQAIESAELTWADLTQGRLDPHSFRIYFNMFNVLMNNSNSFGYLIPVLQLGFEKGLVFIFGYILYSFLVIWRSIIQLRIYLLFGLTSEHV